MSFQVHDCLLAKADQLQVNEGFRLHRPSDYEKAGCHLKQKTIERQGGQRQSVLLQVIVDVEDSVDVNES